ncbi:NHLP leader peptide family RiPP precursor [Paenibacillus daejeonensis]|uniref:NHLP leader peptide family RiPP precursor n=1 Tax=Paenibacillus daejeonensis TaxID=135193 RepID=UPI000373221B|nr:NHLP leader peptide family RiPP precursor [Paenibacillus daejeonensis]
MSAEQTLKTLIIQKAWEDASFKEELCTNPKKAIEAAFGIVVPEEIVIVAVEETTSKFYLVIPPDPAVVLDGSDDPVGMW